MFFVQDHRARVIADNPDVSFGEVGKLLGAKWKELTPSEKKVSLHLAELAYADTQPYEDAAEKDKLRAAKDKEAYAPIKKSSKPSSSKKSKPAVSVIPSPSDRSHADD